MNIARYHGIKWTWFLGYEFLDDKTIEIIIHDRIYDGDPMPVDTYQTFNLIETSTRQVTHAMIDSKMYAVANVKHVFDYDRFDKHPEIVLE